MSLLAISSPRSTAYSSPFRRGLRSIRQEAYDLAQWERTLPEPIATWCNRIARENSYPALDVTAQAGPAMVAALAGAAPFSNAETDATAHWLLDDIATLAGDFADIAECAEVRVRLERVTDKGCAAFHIDTLPLRLLCTYAGHGMQWADEPYIRRPELGLRGRSTKEANAAIVPDAARIRTMCTGAVAIFKGRLWPGGEGRGLIHRSYPVCCIQHARLRLVIDPAGYGY